MSIFVHYEYSLLHRECVEMIQDVTVISRIGADDYFSMLYLYI